MDGKKYRHKPRRNLKDPSAKTASDYIEEIRKLVKDYEKKFGDIPKVPYYDPDSPAYKGIGFHDYDDEEPCAIRSFLRNHPNYKGPIMIACPCRRCSVQC